MRKIKISSNHKNLVNQLTDNIQTFFKSIKFLMEPVSGSHFC